MDGTDKKVDISVIICFYNGGELFKKNIESVSRLKIPDNTRVEFLFVDNNSTDESGEIIKEYARRYPDTFRYLFEPKPGKSYALNLSIREARGDILAFTDSDVILPEDWLLRIKEGFEKHDCAALDGRILPLWGIKPPEWLLAITKNGATNMIYSINDSEKERYHSFDKPVLPGGNSAIKKECFSRYGNFRTDLGPRPGIHLGGEDTDFSCRLLRGGEKLVYYPPITVYHQIPKERITKKYFLQTRFLFSLSDYCAGRKKTGPLMKNVRLVSTTLAKFTLASLAPTLANHEAFHYRLEILISLGKLSYRLFGLDKTIRIFKIIRYLR